MHNWALLLAYSHGCTLFSCSGQECKLPPPLQPAFPGGPQSDSHKVYQTCLSEGAGLERALVWMVHAQKSACTDMRSSYTNRHKQILSLNKMFCNGTERETQREGLLKQERCFLLFFFRGSRSWSWSWNWSWSGGISHKFARAFTVYLTHQRLRGLAEKIGNRIKK